LNDIDYLPQPDNDVTTTPAAEQWTIYISSL
jgi:hypothetical protein